MSEALLSLLATWQNFYVIIGTAAATLTGLMFVVPRVGVDAASFQHRSSAVWYSDQVQIVRPSTTPMAPNSLRNDARFDTDQTSTARRR